MGQIINCVRGQPLIKWGSMLSSVLYNHGFIKPCISGFLTALQPYKSSCPRTWMKCKNIFQFFSLVIKTKLVQNVNRMSERQNDMPKDSQTDRQTDRQKDRQKTKRPFSLVIKTKVVQNVKSMLDSHCVIMSKRQYVATFQLRYQNESCFECHQEKVVIKSLSVRERVRERKSERDHRYF